MMLKLFYFIQNGLSILILFMFTDINRYNGYIHNKVLKLDD